MTDSPHSIDPQRIVSGRGPVSGSGDPIPDQDAIALLDQRVDDRGPDIGVVIKDMHDAVVEKGRHGDLNYVNVYASPTMFDPEQFTGPGSTAKELIELFEPRVPKKIVCVGDLDTSVHRLVADSLPGQVGDLSARLDTSVWLRVAVPRGTIDVKLEGEDVDRADFTIRDLIAELAKPDH